MSNQGYVIKPESKKTKMINMIACAVLILSFIGAVGYMSQATTGSKDKGYQEKVEQMLKEKAAAREAAAAAKKPVSEVLTSNKTK